MNFKGGILLAGLVISFLSLGDSWSFSQEVEVPQEAQVPFLLKILTYDRTLDDKAEDQLNIGVLYNPESEASLEDRDKILKAFEQFRDKTVKGLPVEILPFVLSTFEDHFDLPGSHRVQVLIIVTGNAEKIGKIVDLTRQRKILSFSTSPELVQKGVSIGIHLVEDKMKIVVNYEATKKEGADLSANLLKICQIIRE
jgi:hypothetical protein